MLSETGTTFPVEKVYCTKHTPLHVIQSWVKFCPPDLPLVLVWATTLLPRKVPRWVDNLLGDQTDGVQDHPHSPAQQADGIQDHSHSPNQQADGAQDQCHSPAQLSDDAQDCARSRGLQRKDTWEKKVLVHSRQTHMVLRRFLIPIHTVDRGYSQLHGTGNPPLTVIILCGLIPLINGKEDIHYLITNLFARGRSSVWAMVM